MTGLTVAVFDALARRLLAGLPRRPPPAPRPPRPPPGRRRRRRLRPRPRRPIPADHRLAAALPHPGGPRLPLRRLRLHRQAGRRPLPAAAGAAGRDTMRMPDPGRGRRKKLPHAADRHARAGGRHRHLRAARRSGRRSGSSGPTTAARRRRHTLKSQVAVDEETGRVVDVADSRARADGPTSRC